MNRPIHSLACLIVVPAVIGFAPTWCWADFLPGTALTANPPTTENSVPEAQSRPEFTSLDLTFSVQTGFIILLDSTHDTSIPLAGPPPGNGVKGVPSATEMAHQEDWGDVAQFVNVNGTGRVYFSSDPEDPITKADIGTPVDTILANMGASFPGLAVPTAADNVVFLMERGKGNSGDTGAGEADTDNKYLTDNVTYNLHSDPPGPGAVPEPASLILLGIGWLFGLGSLGLNRLCQKAIIA